MLTVRLSPELEHKLDRIARLTKRSKSFFVKEALEQHLEDLEDLYLALERMSKPKARYYNTAEIKAKLAS